MTTTPTCTVVVSADGGTCGKPAISSFTSSRGETYSECAEHDVSTRGSWERLVPVVETAESLGIRTASTRPFVLVRDGKLVGYADAVTPAAETRARRLGARILPTR